jgi:hypothetical protein
MAAKKEGEGGEGGSREGEEKARGGANDREAEAPFPAAGTQTCASTISCQGGTIILPAQPTEESSGNDNGDGEEEEEAVSALELALIPRGYVPVTGADTTVSASRLSRQRCRHDGSLFALGVCHPDDTAVHTVATHNA